MNSNYVVKYCPRKDITGPPNYSDTSLSDTSGYNDCPKKNILLLKRTLVEVTLFYSDNFFAFSALALFSGGPVIQSDHSGCSLGLADIKTKVLFSICSLY